MKLFKKKINEGKLKGERQLESLTTAVKIISSKFDKNGKKIK